MNKRRVFVHESNAYITRHVKVIRLIDVISPMNWKKINRTLVTNKYNFSFQAFRNYIFDDLPRH